jgi:hypothetical protein
MPEQWDVQIRNFYGHAKRKVICECLFKRKIGQNINRNNEVTGNDMKLQYKFGYELTFRRSA